MLAALATLGAIATAMLLGNPHAAAPALAPTIALRIIAFNDFHGHLEPGENSLPVPYPGDVGRSSPLRSGGAAYLATLIRELRAEAPNSLTISAGDLIGASPLISGLFFDEPTIAVMNAIGLDINAVGNHEFDRGATELQRVARGGCRAPMGGRISCPNGRAYPGAQFPILAANVTRGAQLLLPPADVREIDGVKVGIIGAVTRSTPAIVKPDGVAGLRFAAEAASINRVAAELRQQGVRTIIAVVHEGGETDGGFDACDNPRGAIFEIERELDRSIAVVLSGHTHRAYNCRIAGRPVTQAASFGRLVTVIDLVIDRASGMVVAQQTQAKNIPVPNGLTTDPSLNRMYPPLAPDPQVAAIVEDYRARAAPLASQPAGRLASEFDRIPSPGGDHALGRLIADAQLAATRSQGAVIALTNPSGIRTDLIPRTDQSVTYADVYAAQPFGNALITLTLTGAQLRSLLEQQFRAPERARILQPSHGLSYVWDPKRPVGARIVPDSLRLAGARIEAEHNYRVTVNDFLATGGDRFTILRDGTERSGGELDVDALTDYLRAESAIRPLVPDRQPRIRRVN
ncbi:MAG TPA: bifunctional metallophosphatase/5'-nucleotidase [Burkholderiaceae bacterium]|nr:bifunctional metallophosphatase/5'-nucleotidase [Burkholderiaceae bacterium]